MNKYYSFILKTISKSDCVQSREIKKSFLTVYDSFAKFYKQYIYFKVEKKHSVKQCFVGFSVKDNVCNIVDESAISADSLTSAM